MRSTLTGARPPQSVGKHSSSSWSTFKKSTDTVACRLHTPSWATGPNGSGTNSANSRTASRRALLRSGSISSIPWGSSGTCANILCFSSMYDTYNLQFAVSSVADNIDSQFSTLRITLCERLYLSLFFILTKLHHCSSFFSGIRRIVVAAFTQTAFHCEGQPAAIVQFSRFVWGGLSRWAQVWAPHRNGFGQGSRMTFSRCISLSPCSFHFIVVSGCKTGILSQAPVYRN